MMVIIPVSQHAVEGRGLRSDRLPACQGGEGGGNEMVDKLQQFCHLMSFEAAVQNLQQRLVIVDPGNKSSLDIHAAPTWRPLFLPHLFLSLPPITPIAYSPRFGELKMTTC